ncbi:MAG TPA: redoxin family protein [Bacteroidia bacterium]|nr:redoxin family protein [Bacteroidia bacterium]
MMKKEILCRLFIAPVILSFFFSCSSEEKKVAPPDSSQINSLSLKSLDGKDFPVSDLLKHHRANVFYFLMPGCPMCESYTLTINKLAQKFSARGISAFAVFPIPDYSDEEIISYRDSYHVTIPFYRDVNYSFSNVLGVTVAPEVFVLDSAGAVLYSGSIDNWAYATGKKRMEATEHFLKDALENIVNSKPIAIKSTTAYGCLIE